MVVNSKKPVIVAPKVHPKQKITIYIQPFEGFSDERIPMLEKEIRTFYNVNTLILPYKKIYALANLKGSKRYYADTILHFLKQDLNKVNDKILGLTDFDIYSPKEVNGILYPHWGIFGLGIQPGTPCIVSDFRLKKFKEKTNEFLVNIVLHELGHTFGLEHCNKDKRCLMNDAKGTAATLYYEEKWLCPFCRKMINGEIGEK